ncbi:hypothetical protein [Novosphingobium colocasiae]|uniref:Uncharacterized protein n=1 Tax=Novosphingobium colocasiae TaxID=1256513 RepID=A0A918PGC3_9SPHN|nr:hypothetical protein [Novosphingobium colocasiae]GGZ07803.1 hypothetical protein GCM10011614_23430 [Novosphingobium colocasiae]
MAHNSDMLDDALASLRTLAAPAQLAAIDDGVIGGLRTHLHERATARRSLSLACAVAVVVGLGGGAAFPSHAARADATLLAMPASAPSRLLGE